MALALACGCSAAAGCADNGGGGPDGGGGGGTVIDAGGDPGVVGCVTTTPTACPTPPVTYGTVQPIFQARCVSVCHNGTTPDPNDPTMTLWALADYKHVFDWQGDIRAAIFACTMPPGDAGVPITVDERRAILEWIRCGAPQ